MLKKFFCCGKGSTPVKQLLWREADSDILNPDSSLSRTRPANEIIFMRQIIFNSRITSYLENFSSLVCPIYSDQPKKRTSTGFVMSLNKMSPNVHQCGTMIADLVCLYTTRYFVPDELTAQKIRLPLIEFQYKKVIFPKNERMTVMIIFKISHENYKKILHKETGMNLALKKRFQPTINSFMIVISRTNNVKEYSISKIKPNKWQNQEGKSFVSYTHDHAFGKGDHGAPIVIFTSNGEATILQHHGTFSESSGGEKNNKMIGTTIPYILGEYHKKIIEYCEREHDVEKQIEYNNVAYKYDNFDFNNVDVSHCTHSDRLITLDQSPFYDTVQGRALVEDGYYFDNILKVAMCWACGHVIGYEDIGSCNINHKQKNCLVYENNFKIWSPELCKDGIVCACCCRNIVKDKCPSCRLLVCCEFCDFALGGICPYENYQLS